MDDSAWRDRVVLADFGQAIGVMDDFKLVRIEIVSAVLHTVDKFDWGCVSVFGEKGNGVLAVNQVLHVFADVFVLVHSILNLVQLEKLVLFEEGIEAFVNFDHILIIRLFILSI